METRFSTIPFYTIFVLFVLAYLLRSCPVLRTEDPIITHQLGVRAILTAPYAEWI